MPADVLVLLQQVGDVLDGPLESGIVQLTLREREGQPFEDVAAGGELSGFVVAVFARIEPERAEAAVGVLQLEGALLVRLSAALGALPGAADREVFAASAFDGITEGEQAMGAAAGAAVAIDWLGEFLLEQPSHRPDLSGRVLPRFFGVRVVGQADQLEGELEVAAAGGVSGLGP